MKALYICYNIFFILYNSSRFAKYSLVEKLDYWALFVFAFGMIAHVAYLAFTYRIYSERK